MSDNTEGAGAALEAHSKDASTPGHNPASEATGKVRPPEGGEALQDLLDEAVAFVRAQPLVSVAVCIAGGLVAGKLFSRRSQRK